MNIKKLLKLHTDTEAFLKEYATGKYGNAKTYKITDKVIQKFLKKANESNLEEILSYKHFIPDMLKVLGTKNEGASDLEDYVKYVVNKDKDDE
jgi:hypothetical protein